MNPRGRNPEMGEADASMRSKGVLLISPSLRGLHQCQRFNAALKGRTYDRTFPQDETSEKAFA